MDEGEFRSKDVQHQTEYRTAIFPLDDGEVKLIFPKNISAADIVILDKYLRIFMKKSATTEKEPQ